MNHQKNHVVASMASCTKSLALLLLLFLTVLLLVIVGPSGHKHSQLQYAQHSNIRPFSDDQSRVNYDGNEQLNMQVRNPLNKVVCTRYSSKDSYFRVNEVEKGTMSGRKYFMYSPSGGFNNQRSELEYGLLVSQLLNRTLIVPMAAKHTTWWTKYAHLESNSLIPMDVIFDFSLFDRQQFDFVFSDQSIKELEKDLSDASERDPKGKLYYEDHPKKRVSWKGAEEVLDSLGGFQERVLFLKGPSMYHPWFSRDKRDSVTKSIRFNECLRQLAMQMIEIIVGKLGNFDFNAIHVRMGDYADHGRIPNLKVIAREMTKDESFDTSLPLYIATEPTDDHQFFKPLEKMFPKVFYATDDVFAFVRNELEQQPVFANKEGLSDLLGIVEQLVCLLAKKFHGTSYSNFSNYIKIMRNFTANIFPESNLVNVNG